MLVSKSAMIRVGFALFLAAHTPAFAVESWYAATEHVAADTRLDWMYPLLHRSPAEPPPALIANDQSTAQAYDFDGPADATGGPFPLVIFISPSDRPVGFRLCQPTCRNHGVLFADLIGMGNGKPVARRVRAVLDVLDDIRSRYPIDPDRTYLAGFSGGGHVAATVALHLPEYFGGVASFGHAPMPLPDEPLLQHIERRLSLAIVVGDREPAGAMTEDYAAPYWAGLGVRTEPLILRRHGHTMPQPEVFERTIAWLEQGAAERRAAAQNTTSSRLADAPTRAEWSDRSLADAKAELAAASNNAALDAALLQLEGIAARWPDLPAGQTAKSLIVEYAARPSRPWEAARAARRAHALALNADGLEKLAHRSRSAVGNQQAAFATGAVRSLKQLRQSTDDADFIATVDARIAALEKIIADNRQDAALPLHRVRFDMTGDVTLAEGIDYLRTALARLGYELEVDEAALHEAGVDVKKPYKLRMKAVELKDVDARFLRPAGIKLQRSGKSSIRLVPATPAAPAAKAAPTAPAALLSPGQ